MQNFILRNSKGMSLVEVMIVMTIMSMIGLGTATLMKNMFSIQNRANVKASATEIQTNLISMLKNDTSWSNSINLAGNAAILGCLRDGSGGCNDGVTGNDWQVQDNGNPGAPYYRANQATRGFDMNGAECNTYSAAGNDTCPFRFDLEWEAECGSRPTPCNKPAVTIRGTFRYAPTDASDPRNRINVADYNFTIQRGERNRYEPFEIKHQLTSAVGGGACNPGAWRRRPISAPGEVLGSDIGDNVVVAGDQFTVQPGTYECKVVAQSYEPLTGFNVRLRDTTNGDNYMIGGGFAGYNSTAYASGTVTFQLATAATFEVQHYCDAVGPTDSQFDMGIAALAYSNPSVVTSVSCVRSG